MNEPSIHGGCLCGTGAFEVTPPFKKMIHCHCSRCRKGTGTGHSTNLTTSPDQLKWLKGEGSIKRFDLPSAKNFSKWFCSECGSPLPRLSRKGTMVVIPAGS